MSTSRPNSRNDASYPASEIAEVYGDSSLSADVCDRASALEEFQRQLAVQAILDQRGQSFQTLGSQPKPPRRRKCAGCKKSIPRARLLVMPGATRCVGCQTQVERQWKGR